MRSINVDQVLPNLKEIFLRLSKTKSMTFGRPKTVSNILVRCPIASEDINTFCVCVWFHKISTKSKKSHKLLISSETMGHRMRMFDKVLGRRKITLLVFKSHRNTPVILGNTWSTLFCWPHSWLKSVFYMSKSNIFDDVEFFEMTSYDKYFFVYIWHVGQTRSFFEKFWSSWRFSYITIFSYF